MSIKKHMLDESIDNKSVKPAKLICRNEITGFLGQGISGGGVACVRRVNSLGMDQREFITWLMQLFICWFWW